MSEERKAPNKFLMLVVILGLVYFLFTVPILLLGVVILIVLVFVFPDFLPSLRRFIHRDAE